MSQNIAVPITDSHVHFWETTKLQYPWLGDIPKINKPFFEEDYYQSLHPVANDESVDGIIFVQCDCIREDAIREVEFVTELALRGHSRIKAIVAFAPIEEGEKGMNDTFNKLSLISIQFMTTSRISCKNIHS